MKIVIVTHYFWPENFIINEIAAKLVKLGNSVTVLTGKPNYPDGDIYQGYGLWRIVRETHEGIEVIRVPLIPRKAGGKFRLAWNYTSFILFGTILFPFLMYKRKVDAIFFFAISPITSAIPAIVLKYVLRTKLFLWIQDLWPESLSATGLVQNRYILSATAMVIDRIYKHSDFLLVQSKAFLNTRLLEKYKYKMFYYPNSVDSSIYSQKPENACAHVTDPIQPLGKEFSVVFAGNIGRAQAIGTIVSAAEILAKRAKKIDFFIIGSGSCLPSLQDDVSQRGLNNIYIPGRFKMAEMGRILSRADALLVTLNSNPIFSYTVPSKIQAYLATGKPIIASLNGEGARIIAEEANAGIACPAEDPLALADAISRLYEMPQSKREILGNNGMRYFNDNFDMDLLVGRLVDIFCLDAEQKRDTTI